MGLPHEGLSTAFCCTVHEGRQCVGRGVLQSAVPEKPVNLPQIEKGPDLRHPSYAGVTQTVRRDLIQQPRPFHRSAVRSADIADPSALALDHERGPRDLPRRPRFIKGLLRDRDMRVPFPARQSSAAQVNEPLLEVHRGPRQP